MNSLEYLSSLCERLGVPDPVQEYLAPVVGRWSAMHEEAERWRSAGKAADEVSASLTSSLGSLDANWEGETADSFIAYMQTVGLAGNDMSDAMNAMGEVLDKTADGIRTIVTELASVLEDTSTASAQSMMVAGEERTRAHLSTVHGPTRELFESVRQVLEAFVQLCNGIDGSKPFAAVSMTHTMPAANWAVPEIPVSAAVVAVSGHPSPAAAHPGPADSPGPASSPSPASSPGPGGTAGSGGPAGSAGSGHSGGSSAGHATPAPKSLTPGANTAVGEVAPSPPAAASPAAAVAPAAAAAAAGGMGGMMMPPMMGAGMGGGSQDHSGKSRLVAPLEEIFGDPLDGAPSVIGEDDD